VAGEYGQDAHAEKFVGDAHMLVAEQLAGVGFPGVLLAVETDQASEPIHHIFRHLLAGPPRLVRDLQRITVEVERRGQPAQAGRDHVVVRQALAFVPALGGGGQHIACVHLRLTPLDGVKIPVGGGVHVPRRPVPVQTKGDGRPACPGKQLLLTHIVGPTAAGLADAATDVQQASTGSLPLSRSAR